MELAQVCSWLLGKPFVFGWRRCLAILVLTAAVLVIALAWSPQVLADATSGVSNSNDFGSSLPGGSVASFIGGLVILFVFLTVLFLVFPVGAIILLIAVVLAIFM